MVYIRPIYYGYDNLWERSRSHRKSNLVDMPGGELFRSKDPRLDQINEHIMCNLEAMVTNWVINLIGRFEHCFNACPVFNKTTA